MPYWGFFEGPGQEMVCVFKNRAGCGGDDREDWMSFPRFNSTRMTRMIRIYTDLLIPTADRRDNCLDETVLNP